jgi:hypothetical protein
MLEPAGGRDHGVVHAANTSFDVFSADRGTTS